MIELELLAIAWAASKTKMLIEGMSRDLLEVWTDHAPLVPILEKFTLPEIENKRLQRLKMKIDHLTFKTKWIKGSDNIEADCLSRNPCAKAKSNDELDEEISVVTIAMDAFENFDDHEKRKTKFENLDNYEKRNAKFENLDNSATISSTEVQDLRLKEVQTAAESD
jgi:hypothetical protein